MKRIAGIFLAFAVLVSAPPIYACEQTYVPIWVDVRADDGSWIGGHWQWAWVCVYSTGGSYDYYGSGGGTKGTSTLVPAIPEDLVDQRQLYADAGCAEPAYSQFLDQDEYAATGMGTWFPWDDFRIAGEPYVLVSSALAAGATNIGTCMDNQMPRISAPGTGGGYRLPGQNANTPCGQHVYGNALDLSIRQMDQYGNNTGAHDCTLWNALAACANAAGGWVEPWSDIVASGVLHFHVSFGQPANAPADYGDACAD
jgi:hypothetical protein